MNNQKRRGYIIRRIDDSIIEGVNLPFLVTKSCFAFWQVGCDGERMLLLFCLFWWGRRRLLVIIISHHTGSHSRRHADNVCAPKVIPSLRPFNQDFQYRRGGEIYCSERVIRRVSVRRRVYRSPGTYTSTLNRDQCNEASILGRESPPKLFAKSISW